jgi:hypothetical protein
LFPQAFEEGKERLILLDENEGKWSEHLKIVWKDWK